MKKLLISFILILASVLLGTNYAIAGTCSCNDGSTTWNLTCDSCTSAGGWCPGCSFSSGTPGQTPGATVNLENPLGEGMTDPAAFIGKILQTVLGLTGILAFVMFIYGGLLWMTAMGNSDRVEKGKNIFIWATLGLIVVFSAYAIVRFIFKNALGI